MDQMTDCSPIVALMLKKQTAFNTEISHYSFWANLNGHGTKSVLTTGELQMNEDPLRLWIRREAEIAPVGCCYSPVRREEQHGVVAVGPENSAVLLFSLTHKIKKQPKPQELPTANSS